jgi:hypothetical protein
VHPTQKAEGEKMTDWGGDHVGQASRLQSAVQCLVSGGPVTARLDHALECLQGMLPHRSAMPPSQRNKLDFIFERRRAVWHEKYFSLGELSHKDRRAMIMAIVSLHEACMIDLGRSNDDFTAIIYDASGKSGN